MARFGDIMRTPFSFLTSQSQKEELVAEYVIREHHRGRDLDAIVADGYVTSRCSGEQLQRVLERPDLIAAVGDDVLRARSDDA